MEEAVAEWDELYYGKILKEAGISKTSFAELKGLSPSKYLKCAHDIKSKRRTSDGRAGRKSIVTPGNTEFLIQHAIRGDRANNGHTMTQLADNLQVLQPEIGTNQAMNYLKRTFKKKSSGRLKPAPVKAQSTTSKRSQCTVSQQFR